MMLRLCVVLCLVASGFAGKTSGWEKKHEKAQKELNKLTEDLAQEKVKMPDLAKVK